MKKWIIRKPNAENVKKIMQKSDLSHLAAEILVARGFESIERAADFFAGGELSDPFLIKDMPEAAEIINAAVEDGKSICVYGDYDCDGITATVMLFSYLEALGADVSYYIPERSEGYGMSENAVRKLAGDGVELIITVDNGISAVKEADLIAELGIDLVITDHHQPSEILPKAAAIVDPHRADCTSPFKDLCGAGVVLKLIAALDGGSYDAAMEQFSELAALGTVADIVKLCGENRLIVQNGLHMLENTENLGISALIDQCKLTESKITSTSIGYMIAPRINAAGRFGSPTLAVKLLLSEDDDEAAELAAELSRLNAARKECEQDILAEIEDIIAENPSILNERVLIFSGNNWNAGVIGIVSARIVEKYSKPSFIISINGDVGTGSARGIAGFSIFKSLTACADLFQRFGGHPGAGGFTICTRNIPAFVKNMAEFTKSAYQIMPTAAITAEKVVLPEDLTVKNIESLNVLEPFGEGNVRPIYAILGARINSVIPLSGGKHTKLLLDYGNAQVTLLMFGTEPDNFALKQG
ncbi:MAG: single-stranded-DNA-specific exonuclease RecJ, partial [Oscillospiraceae bacterium]